ncbi:hypothetical protein [Burkholderia seminalis]|uniref:hypothetical protein n=1 Tax=Burkholderia seminalis TaxID=488731 RepID=UPI0031E2217D
MKRRISKGCAVGLGWIVWIVILPYGAEGLWFRLTGKRPTWTDWINWNSAGVIVNMFVAGGTIAAVIAALKISQRDRRRRDENDLTLARLTAAASLDRLKAIRKTVEDALRLRLAVYVARYNTAMNIARPLRLIEPVPLTDIRGMTALPGNCAMQIAAAQGRIHAAIHHCDRMPPADTGEQGDALLHECELALHDALALLENAIKICEIESKPVKDALITNTYFSP